MTTPRPLARDLALLTLAASIGWWAHGSATPVHADSPAPVTYFQFGGTGIDGTLSLYNPADKKIYVYPANGGNSHINCSYTLHIERPGAPIERQNCPIGSTF